MKTNFNHWLCVALMALNPWVTACHGPESAEPEPCDCPGLGGPVKYNQLSEPPISGPDVSYHEPSYQPGTGQQLAYRRASRREADTRPVPAQLTGLWVGNLDSRQQIPLLTGYDLLFRPNYGPRGWIAFNRGDGTVWKAKATGDSLRQLTGGVYYGPVWDRTGTRIACYDPSGPGQGIRIIDPAGALVRAVEVERVNAPLAWSPDGSSLLVEYNPGNSRGIGLYDLTTSTLQSLVMDPPALNTLGVVYGAAWTPDGRKVVWCGEQGIFEVDVASKQYRRLRSSCMGRRYFHPSISPDGQQIAVERLDRRIADDGWSIREETNIWTMDRDGRNEQKLTF